jgi:hypothetical protein
MLRRKQSMEVATAIPAIPATHGQEWAGTVARIATVAVATPMGAKSDDGNSSRNSKNSSSNPCEQQTESRSWLLHFPDREPLTVAFTPAASHTEALASYPSALAAEPMDPGRRSGNGNPVMAGDQETAIRSWLAAIGETDQEAVAEVLTRCRQDADVRRYFLGRAGAIVTDDDRRRCNQCGNLRAGVCTVASPGAAVSAIVGYRPALVDTLRRCAGYSPNARDTDQQTGREIGR